MKFIIFQLIVLTCSFSFARPAGTTQPQIRGDLAEPTPPLGEHTPAPDYGRRVSVTGAIFTLDLDYPSLGDAYRGPDGLVWGNRVIIDFESEEPIPHADAVKYCKNLEARLPTIEEFARLAEYLGAQMGRDYDPHSPTDGKDVIPNLTGSFFWSSSRYEGEVSGYYAFAGHNGTLFLMNEDSPGQYKMGFRCVR